MTRPNPPTPKNWSNQMGWVGSGQFWQVGIRCTPLDMGLTAGYKEMMLPSAPVCVN